MAAHNVHEQASVQALTLLAASGRTALVHIFRHLSLEVAHLALTLAEGRRLALLAFAELALCCLLGRLVGLLRRKLLHVRLEQLGTERRRDNSIVSRIMRDLALDIRP